MKNTEEDSFSKVLIEFITLIFLITELLTLAVLCLSTSPPSWIRVVFSVAFIGTVVAINMLIKAK